MADGSDSAAGEDIEFLSEALLLAFENVEGGGRPFGAIIVADGEIIARAVNEIHLSGDITDHAEFLALRSIAQSQNSELLVGSTVYASGHPCPMCLAAMRMAGVGRIIFAYSNEDAEPFGLSTADIYEDLRRPFPEQTMNIQQVNLHLDQPSDLYQAWKAKSEN